MIPRITKMSIQQSHSLAKTLANNTNIQLILTIHLWLLFITMPSFYLWFFVSQWTCSLWPF